MLKRMTALFARIAKRGLKDSLRDAVRGSDISTDFRSAICHFEDDLFANFPAGHGLVDYYEATEMVSDIFQIVGRKPPRLTLVERFTDPRVGAFADINNRRIAIARHHLYRFLVLHESAHFIVPTDRRHGPAFTYVLQLLYRSFIDIPEDAVRCLLQRHRLPSFTGNSARARPPH
jgi:hypothetical protein